MKKVILSLSFALCTILTNAQDLKKVSTLALLNRWEEAKTELDKALNDPKISGKPEALVWKIRVYAALAKDPKLSPKYPEALSIADSAFTEYAVKEPSLNTLKTSNAQNAAFDLYATYNKLGVDGYNTKKYDSAGYYFSRSINYIDLILKNKWTSATMTMDTTSVLYAGISYQNAKNQKEAAKYFGRIADAHIAGKDMVEIYRFLLIYNIDTKNKEDFNKYLALSKELYPATNWEDYDLEYFNKSLSLKEKADLFDKEDFEKTTYKKYMFYGDAFANSKDEKKDMDTAQLAFYDRKAIEAFKKAADKNPEDGLTAYNVGILTYNKYLSYDDEYHENIKKLQAFNVKRSEEKNPTKKAQLDAQYKEFSDLIKKTNAVIETNIAGQIEISIEYLEKAYNKLKSKTDISHQEKNCLGRSVDFLSNLYAYKRDKARGRDPKKYDEYDAKYKIYDDLHGKF